MYSIVGHGRDLVWFFLRKLLFRLMAVGWVISTDSDDLMRSLPIRSWATAVCLYVFVCLYSEGFKAGIWSDTYWSAIVLGLLYTPDFARSSFVLSCASADASYVTSMWKTNYTSTAI